MNNVLVFLTTGFEEIEALGTIDILRRAGLNVQSVSLTGDKCVEASHGVKVMADALFAEVDFSGVKALVIPGGTPNYKDSEELNKVVVEFAAQSDKYVAAICASPMVLGLLGLLKGKKATAYPGFEQYLEGAILETDKAVVVDGNIVTGRGPGLTIDFALKLVELLAGEAKSNEVSKGLLVR